MSVTMARDPVSAHDARASLAPAADDAELGIAINTRNYNALLARTSAVAPLQQRLRRVSTESNKEEAAAAATGVAVPSSDAALSNYNFATPSAIDCTVEGVPMDTGNLAALLDDPFERYMTSRRLEMSLSVLETGAAVTVTSDEENDSSTNNTNSHTNNSNSHDNKDKNRGSQSDHHVHHDDVEVGLGTDPEAEDAVLGLPITTGNYRAMYRQGGGDNMRQRGYSDLAPPPLGRSRVSTSARHSATAADFPTAATMTSSQWRASEQQQRGESPARRPQKQQQQQQQPPRSTESCFDTRRSSQAAVSPHKGWLFIQSPTMRAWKKYYAVLSGLDFRYSRDQGHSPKGFGMIQSVQRWDGKPHGVTFVYTSGAQVQTYCATHAAREEWVNAANRAIQLYQSLSGHSKTSYTLTTGEQHEGYLFKQERSNARMWRRYHFLLRQDGYLTCQYTGSSRGSTQDTAAVVDERSSGWVKSVAFADVHPNGLAIQLDAGKTLFVYGETYDDRMLWYAAVSAACAHDKTPRRTTSVKSSYVHTMRSNHAGWLFKQVGLFKTWKRVYFTLHGVEIGFAKDTNSPLDECDKIDTIEDWDGRQHGLEIRGKSGKVWRVYAESYETAKYWRNLMGDACRGHVQHANVRRYLASRKRKNLSPLFGGWLTTVTNTSCIRQFFVMDGTILGKADDVDNLLKPIGNVVDISVTRDTANGMVIAFADGSRIKVAGDSIESATAWYDCLSSTLRQA